LTKIDKQLGELLNFHKQSEDVLANELCMAEQKLEKAVYERESIERRMMYLLSDALKNVKFE